MKENEHTVTSRRAVEDRTTLKSISELIKSVLCKKKQLYIKTAHPFVMVQGRLLGYQAEAVVISERFSIRTRFRQKRPPSQHLPSGGSALALIDL